MLIEREQLKDEKKKQKEELAKRLKRETIEKKLAAISKKRRRPKKEPTWQENLDEVIILNKRNQGSFTKGSNLLPCL